ncbi:alpha/beta hydrolase [Streptomyces sp. ISL-11]|uniref:alpha/beta hydrolase n=1 Tax=Streptomyces sp. ISL-11 TaxID=2819174 RepID=UPI001BE58B42|nr:alpha/beta hydrolase [Streptomyces sp. ISL-11]MBT2386560.1 alpha/beta fold hydrolase [Streptomyces sp. ISL-11]
MSPHRPRALALASAALAVALAASGCADERADTPGDRSDAAGGGPAPDARPRWAACPAPTAAQGGDGKAPGKTWECAKLPVPLDYGKPDGEKIELALIRSKAKDASHRLGSLVFNFGGPGGSGVSALPGLAQTYDKLRERYDLVSFDPRGVGESATVRCQSDKELDATAQLDATPDDDAEVRAALETNKAYVNACRENSGRVLPHVDTISAARDLDRLRAALGDAKLHYFGISYGTELGGVYAHLFPRNVGRAVLDAVVDPTQDPLQGSLGQTKGFQLALDNYLKDCAAGGRAAGCPSQEQITGLLKKLDTSPLPTAQSRKLTQDEAVNGIASALYSKDTWKYLTAGLKEAMGQGSGNTLLALFDALNGRAPDGRYSNLQAANRAISCADAEQRYTVDDVRRRLPEFREASPVFGESAAWALLGCTDWPVKGRWKNPDVSAGGAAPIVVVGNTGDPATPYAGARQMARQLGKGVGVEVTYQGEGHGAYNSGNPCMVAAVNGYLLDGKVPSEGTTCS